MLNSILSYIYNFANLTFQRNGAIFPADLLHGGGDLQDVGRDAAGLHALGSQAVDILGRGLGRGFPIMTASATKRMNSTSTLPSDLELVQVSGVFDVQLQYDAVSPLDGDAPLHHIHRRCHHPRGRRGLHDEGAGPLVDDGCPLNLFTAEAVLNPLPNSICSIAVVLHPNPLPL